MDSAYLKSHVWKNYGRWKQPTISGTFWTHWHEAKSALEITKDGPVPHIIFLDGYHLTLQAEDEATKHYFSTSYDKGTLGDFYERFERVSKECEERHLALLEKKSLPDLDYLSELFDSYLEMVGSWGFLFRFSSSLEEIARERGLAETDDDMLLKMRPYMRTTWLEEQTLEINELARELLKTHSGITPDEVTVELISKNSELLTKINKHVEKFAWFGTHHWEGEGYSMQKCVADMQGALRKGVENENPLLTQSETDDKVMWKLLASSSYWRTHCAEVTAKVVYASRGCLEGVARKWGMSYRDLTYLSSHEIIEALKKSDSSIESPENYSERRNGYGCYVKEEKEHIITGAVLEELIDAAVPKVDTMVKELKGVVASKGGVIRGTARIILAPSDFARFKDGDILVANETTPDFVPLMKKALAIVTDTGGITSHAAIVSRELRKPCVIGTKIATQVIKDGVQIEVDTEKGIVKIL